MSDFFSLLKRKRSRDTSSPEGKKGIGYRLFVEPGSPKKKAKKWEFNHIYSDKYPFPDEDNDDGSRVKRKKQESTLIKRATKIIKEGDVDRLDEAEFAAVSRSDALFLSLIHIRASDNEMDENTVLGTYAKGIEILFPFIFGTDFHHHNFDHSLDSSTRKKIIERAVFKEVPQHYEYFIEAQNDSRFNNAFKILKKLHKRVG